MASRTMTERRPRDGYVKSSFSEGGGQCVLVRRQADDPNIFLRDSKYERNPRNRPEDEPIIEMPATAWATFAALVLNPTDQLVVAAPEVEFTPEGGGVVLRGNDGATLIFTTDEWEAFRAGLAAGEFERRAEAA
ncbi:DUF397 domain-containing protein [Nocardia uniformis]|nr:DUF397 domain-containing protein [Nocardia uniformis]